MGLIGEIIIPPDKSISHRSLIFGSLVKKPVKISNLSLGQDCISTLKILEKLGVKYEFLSERDLLLDGSNGLFANETVTLDCGNSGTTARLMSGLLAGLNLNSILIGDKSLSKRPMKRVIEPLELMGADIKSNENKLPIEIKGTELNSIEYHSPIASAQVKSCILLAGLNAKGKTVIYEPYLSRNHSEIMLEYLNANIKTGYNDKGYFSEIEKSELTPKNIEITGDISSAAFFMVAAAIVEGSCLTIKNVGINPTRSGILDVFNQAQINYSLKNKRYVTNELTADIEVCYTPDIKPFEIKGDLIPRLIDEIPILAILATQANGISKVMDAHDLRNKESDRIKAMVENLSLLNTDIEEIKDGFIVKGKTNFNKSATIETHLDHRLAMSFYVLNLINKEKAVINGFDCTNTSFPEFLDLAKKVNKQ